VPSRIRDVANAAAVSSIQGSPKGRRWRLCTTWSQTNSASQFACSAAAATVATVLASAKSPKFGMLIEKRILRMVPDRNMAKQSDKEPGDGDDAPAGLASLPPTAGGQDCVMERSRQQDVYCRHCGVRLRRLFGRWLHVRTLGPVKCQRPEPEA
jgi:hypothetical protein